MVFDTLAFCWGFLRWLRPWRCQAPVSVTASPGTLELNGNVMTLKVCIISISVLIISVGKPSVRLAVRDSSERCVVVKTRVEDLIHYFLRLVAANVPHSQDGAKGAASDALLSEEKKHDRSVGDTNLKPASESQIYPRGHTWWCCFKPKLNLAASLLKEQSPLRLAARIWNETEKKSGYSANNTSFIRTKSASLISYLNQILTSCLWGNVKQWKKTWISKWFLKELKI